MNRRLTLTINLLIMGFILFFIFRYANAKAEESCKNEIIAFEKMTVTTNQIIANYLEDERHLCDIWANLPRCKKARRRPLPNTAPLGQDWASLAERKKRDIQNGHPPERLR